MKFLKRKLKMVVSIAVAVALIASASVYYFASAVWDESTAVHITPSEIENSTLAIGTHLIHLSALTQDLYDIAKDSASDSEQNNIYYKSELADGTWFDISSATSLDDITTSKGTPVDDSVIAALYFTYHTKSDGITYDLRTNQAVCIQDIKNPYELEKMDELLPLKTQYDLIKEEQASSSAGKTKISRIDQFWATSVKDTVTNQADSQIASLQTYYDVLCNNKGGKPEMEAVQGVMDSVDATRRAEVFSIVSTALNAYAVELQQVQDSTDSDGNVTPGSGSDTNLQSAVNDSLSNVTDSLTTYQGKMLSEGTTIMSKEKYKVSMQLITDAQAPNHAACDKDVADLIALDNIMNSVVASKDTELGFLQDSLLPEATDQYLNAIKAGVSADYTAAVSANSSQVVLKNLSDTNKTKLNTYRNELEFYITAECLRLSNSDAKDFISKRLDQAYHYSETVPNDGFADGANETVKAHIDFLEKKLRELELGSGGTSLDQLITQKADLQTKYLSALDHNDLATAKTLEDQISALDEQIDSLSGGDNDGGAGELASELKNEGLGMISGDENQNAANLGSVIDSLTGMLDENSKLAFPALKDIRDAMVKERDLNGNTTFDDQIASIEDTITNNQDAYDNAMRSELSESDFNSIATKYFAGTTSVMDAGSSLTGGDSTDVSKLSDNDKALVNILALKMYYDQTQSDTALSLMSAKAQNQINLGNPLIFERVDDVSCEYLPVTAVASYTGMRYVWRSSLQKATLAKGSDYYVFTVYSDQVERSLDASKTDSMSTGAKFKTVVHIPEDYTYDQFGVDAVYLDGTTYGALSSDDLQKEAAALFNDFLAQAATKTGS